MIHLSLAHKKSTQFFFIFMLLTLNACTHQASTPQSPQSPIQRRTPEQIRETENRLFGVTSSGTSLSWDELARAQRVFLDQDVENAYPRRSNPFLPAAPMIGHYEEEHDDPVFPSPPIQAVQLPQEFYQNIPAEIRSTVVQYDVRELDLFLIIQKGSYFRESHNVSLKAHVWAYPDLPTYFSGELFDRNILMGIFLSDHDLSREVPIHEMAPFRVYLHDSRFSPNTARMRFYDESVSFWSVIVDEVTQRAAVTLHLLVQDDHVFIQNEWVRNGQVFSSMSFYFNRHSRDRSGASSSVNHTLNGMMNRLRTEGADLFQGTPLMEKLESLLHVAGT